MGKNLKKAKSFRFTDEELEILERLSGDRNMTETVVAGLKALDQQGRNAPSDEELLQILAARLKGK